LAEKFIQMMGFTTVQYASIQSNRQPKCCWINPIQKARPTKILLDGKQRFTRPMVKYCLFSSYITISKGNDAYPDGIHEFYPYDSSQSFLRSMVLVGSLVYIASCPAMGVDLAEADAEWAPQWLGWVGGWGAT
jgi:hypothetical protein